MRKFVISILGVLILAAMLGGGCVKSSPAPSERAPAPAAQQLDIGVCSPLTGPAAFLGAPEARTLEMLVEAQNKKVMEASRG